MWYLPHSAPLRAAPSPILPARIVAPVAYYNLTTSNIAISSVFNTTLQAVSICGGYDARVEEQLYSNLLARGLIESGGLSSVTDIIAADKTKPVGERQVVFECNSDQIKGDAPVYRAYSTDGSAGISLKVSVLVSRQRQFLAAISGLIGIHKSVTDGYHTLNGYIFSQLPRQGS